MAVNRSPLTTRANIVWQRSWRIAAYLFSHALTVLTLSRSLLLIGLCAGATAASEFQSATNLSKLSPSERILAAQIFLTRQALSPGSIDGLIGPKTRAALKVFQEKEKLPTTAEPDTATLARLV